MSSEEVPANPSDPEETVANNQNQEEAIDNSSSSLSKAVLEKQAKRSALAAARKVEKSTLLKKVNSAWIGVIGIAIWITILQVSGLAIFTKGFLLSRPVFEDYSECSIIPEGAFQESSTSQKSGCWADKSFDKAVLVVIDALRFDFTIPTDKSPNHFENKLPFLYNEFIENPANSLLLKFMADPPTTTLQRLKGLTTGSLPTFFDAGSNFAGTEILEDNWLAQATKLNKTIAFTGDDTWTSLFPNQLHPNISFPYDSLNVWDLDTVDNGVTEHIFPILNGEYGHWDIAIGHLLGVDHAGHKYGPNHIGMRDKLKQMNEFILKLVNSIDEHTLLVIMGDHGMDLKGDHGGESVLELESSLWMYSKKPFFGREDSAVYDTSNSGKNYRSVSQIDFVSTFSLLIGLPVPFNNLGTPITEAFIGPNSDDYDKLAAVELLTASQIHRYTELSKSASESTLNEIWSKLVNTPSNSEDIVKSAINYQTAVIEHYREKWIKFHLPDITKGIILIAASLASIFIAARNITGGNALQTAKKVSISAGIFSLGGFVYKISDDLIYSVAVSLSLGIVLGFVSVKRPIDGTTPVESQESKEGSPAPITSPEYIWTILAIGIVLVHALLFTSNSFTVWESNILNYLLASFGLVAFIYARRIDDVVRRTITSWHCVAFIALTKISSLSILCREEHGVTCNSTFYQNGSSITSPYALIVLTLVSLALPRIIISFYKSSESYHGSGPVWISIGLQTLMTLSSIYWVIDGAETYNWSSGGSIDYEVLHTTKVLLARIGLGASLIAGTYGWIKGTLCCQLDFEGSRPVLKGYFNVYGSFTFLFVLNIFAAALIVNKTMGAIILSIMIYHSLTLMEILHLLRIKDFIIGPVVFGLLGSAYFFSTGHQATIPSIQWDVGFIPSKTISFPLTHLAILLNSLGPFILTALITPIVPLWKTGPFKSGETAFTKAIKAALVFIAYHTVVALSSMIWATYFRRHLMVWKIFAPRFMLAAVTLPTVGVSIALALFAVGYTVHKVSSIF